MHRTAAPVSFFAHGTKTQDSSACLSAPDSAGHDRPPLSAAARAHRARAVVIPRRNSGGVGNWSQRNGSDLLPARRHARHPVRTLDHTRHPWTLSGDAQSDVSRDGDGADRRGRALRHAERIPADPDLRVDHPGEFHPRRRAFPRRDLRRALSSPTRRRCGAGSERARRLTSDRESPPAAGP